MEDVSIGTRIKVDIITLLNKYSNQFIGVRINTQIDFLHDRMLV